MIAIDTNILVYAHRADSPWHAPARRAIEALAEGRTAWAIPWPCLHEFLAVVTHPRIYRPPTPLPLAIDQVSAWLESPVLMPLSENNAYWDVLRRCLSSGLLVGPQVHDARIAGLSLAHGVRELWTHDRDFSRFPALTVRNPLVAPAS